MGRLRAAALMLAAPLVWGGEALRAQDPDTTFRVDVRLVRMLATVKDTYGRPVGGLTKADFAVSDNGVLQEIALFERHTEQPLSVGILLDVSGSTNKEMRYQTDAVQRFVHALFREGNPGDRAALYPFNWQVSLAVPYTRDPERFRSEMRRLKGEAGTSMYDAVYLASKDIAERQGRHVLIVVTDGGDTVSSTTYQQALEAAHASDVVVYAILTMPITNDAGRNVGGENALTLMSQTTGGKLFAPGLSGLDEAFEEIIRDLRTQYLIGYYPRGVPATKDRFHRIQITTQRPDLRVISRTGYYGDFEASTASPSEARGDGDTRRAPRTSPVKKK